MRSHGSRCGAVLVTVLLLSAAVWVLIAGTVVTVRLRHDLAVAALHNARARVVALTMAERADAYDWWFDAAGEHIPAIGTVGHCAWTVRQVQQTSAATHYSVRASYGRAEVVVEGTSIR